MTEHSPVRRCAYCGRNHSGDVKHTIAEMKRARDKRREYVTDLNDKLWRLTADNYEEPSRR